MANKQPVRPGPKRKNNRLGAVLLAGALLFTALGYHLPSWMGKDGWSALLANGTTAVAAQETAALRIHCIDVGQGDCTLVQSGGQNLLIDGGERGNEEAVVRYLKQQGVERLDYVVATHPHSDHIGGLAYGVLAAFPVGTLLAPRLPQEATPTTQTYETFLAAVRQLTEAGTKALYARPGETYPLGEAAITVLGPLREDSENNNNSVVVQIAYGAAKALFSGDAEKTAELALVQAWGAQLQSSLLKAGHHGSRTSSSEAFLRAVKPQYMVISCGANNTYGHPHPFTLQRCRDLGIAVFRTDLEKTIVFAADKKTIWPER